MHRPIALLIFVALFLSAGVALSQQKYVVDKMLVMIETTAITAGDLEIEKKILHIHNDSLLFSDNPALLSDRQVFKELVIREIFYPQSIKLGFVPAKPEQVKKALDEFVSLFESPDAYLEFLKANELSDDRFDKKMEASTQWQFYEPIDYRFKKVLSVSSFMDKKIGLPVRLTLASRFEKQKEKLMAKYPDASEQELKSKLETKLYLTNMGKWIQGAIGRTSVRILEPQYADVFKSRKSKSKSPNQ